MSFAGLGLGFGDAPKAQSEGAELHVIPAFDGFRLVWSQRNGSLIYLEDEEGRALVFATKDVAYKLAQSAQKLTGDM